MCQIMQYLLLYCSSNLRFLLEFWANRRHSSMKSGQGQHALCLSWKWCGNFHLVDLSAVSKQCKRDLREARLWRTLILCSARCESSGERHYQLFLQCTQTHSRESLVHPGIYNSSKITLWWMLHPLFCSCPSPPVARGKGPSFMQNAGMEPFHLLVHREWQSRASASESEIQILVHKWMR